MKRYALSIILKFKGREENIYKETGPTFWEHVTVQAWSCDQYSFQYAK